MAIYHLHIKVLQRSKGKNAVSSAAYRRAARLYDEKEDRCWDYTNKKDVIHSELLIPKDAPLWAKELVELHAQNPSKASERLWNDVETAEKRVDSQLAREAEFALPLELDQAQNIQLAREFIQDQFVLRGMIADWNVHWDEGNPHVHVLLTMRWLTQEGFGKRVLEWNQKDLLREWRQRWAEYVNFHLRLHQHDVRIDHRSYEDQGIDLVPSLHQGKAVTDMDRRGISTEIMKAANEVREENLARISADPKVLLNKITSQSSTFTGQQLGQELGRYVNDQGRFSAHGSMAHEAGRWNSPEEMEAELRSQNSLTAETIHTIFKSIEHHESVFTERDLAKAIQPFTNNADQFAKTLLQIKGSSELIYLGPGEDGRDRFTTRNMFALENELQNLVDRKKSHGHVTISDKQIQVALKHYQHQTNKSLTGEQFTAINHILKSNSISCLVGRAGTGKSFSLGAARAVWESMGLKVQGIALSGIAADGLMKDAGINSRTIESFRYAVGQGSITIGHHDLVVMDEAGMTDSVSMLAVLKAVFEARAKLVLVGDHGQLQPVGPGATFRALLERLGFAELQIIYRQVHSWQREATVAFSAGRVADGLSLYEQHDCIHLEGNEQDAFSQLIHDWTKARADHPKNLSEFLVLAHRNEDVALLNKYLRAERVSSGELAEGYTVRGKSGDMLIAPGDRLLFLKNSRRLGLSNGRFATIQSVDFTEAGRVISFVVMLDGLNQAVRIEPESYNKFIHGYAATVHKSQGITVDHSFIYAGGTFWNRHLTYVAMTRHRESCHLYTSKEIYRDLTLLKKQLGRVGIKDSILDSPLAFAERRGIDTDGLLKLLPEHLAKRLKVWKDKLRDQVNQVRDPEFYEAQKAEIARDLEKVQATAQRREDARLVAAYADSNQEVGMAWRMLQSSLVALGLNELSYETEAYALISGTREYKALQSALSARDKNAHQLMQEPDRYEKAIERYSFDLIKLQKEAEHYSAYTRVQHYLHCQQQGKIVYRDQAAAEIMRSIKKHYGYLKGAGLNTQTLKSDAIAHLRREIFVQVTPEQRTCFRVVEAYQDCNRRFGIAWSQHKDSQNEPIKHASAKQLESLVQQRDRLAFQIVKDSDLYSEALNFYQIGQATSLFGEKISQEYERKACARWFKLQDHAAGYERHEHKNTVQVVKEKITYTDLKSDSALICGGAEKTTTHLNKLSLKEVLSQYVAMEVEQTRLVSHLHSTRLKDTNAAKEISREAIAHSNLIKVFSVEATQLPQVKQEIEALKAIRPANVTQRGGFIAIRHRINKNEWAKEDIHALLVQLRGKSLDKSRDRSEDRGRGGRSQ